LFETLFNLYQWRVKAMEKKLTGFTKPLRLGTIDVKNRIWNSPLWTRTATADGEVSDRTIAHYLARAKGGAGVITTEGVAVDDRHIWKEPQIRLDADRFAPGHRRLVEAVHLFNTPILCQLHHAGMFGTDPVSPSGIPCQDMGKIGQFIEPKILTTSEVEEIRDLFIEAALRAKEVGYDGVEVHGATAYLLEQFFSPHNNKRVDKYGGSLQGRMQLPLEIVQGIRQVCGPNYIVGYTAADCDMIPGGIDRKGTTALATTLEQAGLTYFDLQTDGTYETFHLIEASAGYRRQPKGQFDKTAFYKSILKIPVTTRGAGEYDPIVWNDAFENDKADAIRLGKQMLADPEVANKALKGTIEDIRPCIKCGNCLFSGEITNHQLSCSVNPGLGRMETPVVRANISKKVLVIGGGPAGLEVARVSALRGHTVTLVEKQPSLGGNNYIASLPIGKDTFKAFIDWSERQCKKLGVDIRLNTTVTEDFVEKMKPDAIVVATGGTPLKPPIKGIDKSHIFTAEAVLSGQARIGKKVVIAGAGEVGIETADFLMEKFAMESLSVVEMLDDIGPDMNPMDKALLFLNPSIFPKHFKNGLRIMTGTKIREFTERGVGVIDKQFREYEIEADTIVLALGYASNNKLYKELKDKYPEIYLVGDAGRVRKIVDAIYQANYFSREI
jgi:2,4-dienoyl-CoA reductase-like NADH-dependent reductase (Old Yellow Enzyme family)/thioredoxin reductase